MSKVSKIGLSVLCIVLVFFILCAFSTGYVSNLRKDIHSRSSMKKLENNGWQVVECYKIPDQAIYKEDFKTQLSRRHLDDDVIYKSFPKDSVLGKILNDVENFNIEDVDVAMTSLKEARMNFKVVKKLSETHLQYLKKVEHHFKNDEEFKYYLVRAIQVKIIAQYIIERLENTEDFLALKADADFKLMLRSLNAYSLSCFSNANAVLADNYDLTREYRNKAQSLAMHCGVVCSDVMVLLFKDEISEYDKVTLGLFYGDEENAKGIREDIKEFRKEFETEENKK